MSRIGEPFPYQTSDLNADGQQDWGPLERAVLSAIIDTVQQAVTADGLDLNGNVDLQGHGLINAAFVQFALSGDAGLLRQEWSDANGDLWYRDGQNRAVQVTSGGALAVAASTGGWVGDLITTNPNGASYDNSTGVFSLTAPSPVGTAGKLNVGAVRIREGADTDYVGLNVPASLPGTYNLTFPATLPAGAQSIVVCDATGGLNYRLSSSFTNYYDPSKGIASSGVPTYGIGGWSIGAGAAVDVEVPYRLGDRIDSVSWGQANGGFPITGTLIHRADNGNTAVIARCCFNDGVQGLHTLQAGQATMTGTLPFTPPGTGSLILQIGTTNSVGLATYKVTGLRKIIS